MFEASYLYANGLRFRGGLKVIERFWEVGPGSVCPIYCGVEYDRLENCEERPSQCTLCAGPHRLDEHRCRVNSCQSGSVKSCSHITPTCANWQSRHRATFFKCPVKYKAEKEARKRKEKKKKETDESSADEEPPADKEPPANRDNENKVPAHGPEEENLD